MTPLAEAATAPSDVPTAGPWLTFASTLVWQAIVVAALILFRAPLAALLKRVAKASVGGTEIVFQPQTEEAAAKAAARGEDEARAISSNDDVLRPGPDGFLEASTVRRVVEKLGELQPGEAVSQLLLLFATQSQRTWLVSTNHRLFYVLDDRNTQATRELIQRVQHFAEIDQVRAEPEDDTAGVVYIGGGSGWYYSVPLHPNPKTLRNRIQAMIRRKQTKERGLRCRVMAASVRASLRVP